MQMKALKFAIAIYEKALEEMSQQTEAKREKKWIISAHIIKTEVNLDLETDPSGGFFFSQPADSFSWTCTEIKEQVNWMVCLWLNVEFQIEFSLREADFDAQ